MTLLQPEVYMYKQKSLAAGRLLGPGTNVAKGRAY